MEKRPIINKDILKIISNIFHIFQWKMGVKLTKEAKLQFKLQDKQLFKNMGNDSVYLRV